MSKDYLGSLPNEVAQSRFGMVISCGLNYVGASVLRVTYRKLTESTAIQQLWARIGSFRPLILSGCCSFRPVVCNELR